jgi:hypothetical protein
MKLLELLPATLLATTALLPSAAFAKDGADSSGGGLTVVCFDDSAIVSVLKDGDGTISDVLLAQAKSIEAFDLYEAKLPRGWEGQFTETLIPINDGETAEQYAERLIKRLDHSVPALARVLRETRDGLKGDKLTYTSTPLPLIEDALPSGAIDTERCVLSTMGANRITDGAWSLTIDERQYKHKAQSEWSRGVFLLHEYIYITFRRLQQQSNSRRTRELLNYLIFDNDRLAARDMLRKARELTSANKISRESLELRAYTAEAVEPIVTIFVGAARDAFARFVEREKALVTKVDTALKPYNRTCKGVTLGGRYLAPCFNAVQALKRPELAALEKEMVDFIVARNDAVIAATRAAADSQRDARIMAASVLPPAVSDALVSVLHHGVLDAINELYTEEAVIARDSTQLPDEGVTAASRELSDMIGEGDDPRLDYRVEVIK